MKKKGFTLLEVLIATTCFLLLLVIVLNMYPKMVAIKYSIQARTNLIQDTHGVIEKIQLLLKNYTIDYEEYYDRTNVGCVDSAEISGFARDVGTGGYCTRFTSYGNNTPNGNTGQQNFGAYQQQFAAGIGPTAVSTNLQAKELYLISQDGTQRVFIRRALVDSGDRNQDGSISGDNERQYAMQILKLKGFDAGTNHDFDSAYSGVYDGQIDTRACDYAQGFICNGDTIGTNYSGYKLPTDANDGRANLTQNNITINQRHLFVYPTKNPRYATGETDMLINPYFTINLASKLYGKIRFKKLSPTTINDFIFQLQTTLNTKNFYN